MSTYNLIDEATRLHDAYRALSMAELDANKAVVRTECDIEEAQAQKAFGMVAILRGQLNRQRAYAAGITKAKEIIDG